MMKKEFEIEEYEKFDRIGKDIVRKCLDSYGFYTLINPIEDYKADIKAIRIEAHEVEIKRNWTGEWPEEWKVLHIPERKGKLLENNKLLFFWVISGDLKRALVVKGTNLKSSMLREVPNSKIPEGERMYCIPISLCTQINITKLTKIK